jgi:hypothetical protein
MCHSDAMPPARSIAVLVCSLFFASASWATTFEGPALLKTKVRGGGSLAGFVATSLVLGPDAGEGVGVGEFRLRADDGQETLEIVGSYSVDAKGQPVLTPDLIALGLELRELIVHVCEDILQLPGALCDELAALDIAFDPTKVKSRFKSKDGSVIQFTMSVPFALTDGIDSVRASVSLKGRLAPAP